MKQFPIVIEQDMDGVFIVSCPIIQGCHSYGRTMDEAVANIMEAIQVCLEEQNTDKRDHMRFIGIREIELAL
jgi:predicted RNase H-like HicB family nuclease